MTLTFVVPVRHHASVPDWNRLTAQMQQTAGSIAQQDSAAWNCVFVCNRDSPLPALGPGIDVVRVDLDYIPLPEASDDLEARFEAIRADKGRRVLSGLIAARPSGHVMVVDYDDFVHRRLASHAADHPDQAGWYLGSGLVYDGSRIIYRITSEFDELCGTSLILHSNTLDIPGSMNDIDETYLRQWFGSHKFAKRLLAASGRPLARLPFDGAVYRIGYAGATSASSSVIQTFAPKYLLRKQPRRFFSQVKSLRLLSQTIREDFGIRA